MFPEGGRPAEILLARERIAERVEELAGGLTSDYLKRPEPPVFVGVLRGAAIFLADLVRAASIDIVTDFISISSYDASEGQSGIVRIVKDLDLDVSGRDVVVVEDIVDTGLTLNYLRNALEQRQPASLRVVALMDKAARRIAPVPIEYVGFEVPDLFVVGYGLDFQGRYRNLPDVLAVHDLARLINDPGLLQQGHLKPNVRC
ncbi:MAG: hypoxanthine phosphoribosyltransferase [Actinobacteria bacterium]|nr:hypoxanthine phosphoribosyltransferase [Actinomycetota bacterium]MDQ3531882.1 hypoxanthine phosphoribosyltransferase [Actinomycetota bacterium]